MVQIYENPKGLAAAQVANQHNPEFAALNSITASYADGPITAAMAQMELDDKFGGLKGALRQKQLDRKWAKGDKQWDWLNQLKFLQSQKGYNPSNMTNLDRAFVQFARGNQRKPYTLPDFESNFTQDAQISIPNMQNVSAASNPMQLKLKMLGKDYTDALENISRLHKAYVEDDTIDREALDNAIHQLSAQKAADIRQKPKGPTAISDGSKPSSELVAALQGLFSNNKKYMDLYNQSIDARPWTNIQKDLSDYSGLTEGIRASQRYNQQQKFIQSVEKDLNNKGVMPLSKEQIDNIYEELFAMGYDPSTQIPVMDSQGQVYLYNTSTNRTAAGLTQVK